MVAFIGGLGMPEIGVILLIILLLFGAKKIPEIMRGLGKGIREFKAASQEAVDEIKTIAEESPGESKSDEGDKPLAG